MNALLEKDLRLLSLERWLGSRLGLKVAEVKFSPASNGFSAETIFAALRTTDNGTHKLVIRLEQPGGEIFLETDVANQARTIAALAARGIPVPPLLALEEDASILGSRFLVMQHVEGRGFPQAPSYFADGWVKQLSPQQRGKLWKNALTLMGGINRLDAGDGFGFLDRPHHGVAGIDQYLGWLRAWRDQVIGDQPSRVIDAAIARLEADRPHGLAANVIWGDANPCNILFADNLSVATALDFEAAALAPAEVDLGWWFFLDRRRGRGHQALSGVPDRAKAIEIYQNALGRTAVAIDYFEIMGGVRMSLVIARTVRRLVDLGLLAEGLDVASDNPMTVTLAELIDIEPPKTGPSFEAFVTALKTR